MSGRKISAKDVSELPAVLYLFALGASHVRRSSVVIEWAKAGPCFLASSTEVSTMLLQFNRDSDPTWGAQCRARPGPSQSLRLVGMRGKWPRVLHLDRALGTRNSTHHIIPKHLPHRYIASYTILKLCGRTLRTRGIGLKYGDCWATYEGDLVRCVAFSRFFLLPKQPSYILTCFLLCHFDRGGPTKGTNIPIPYSEMLDLCRNWFAANNVSILPLRW